MFRTTIMLSIILLLTACATSPPVPEDQFYQLDPVLPQQILTTPVLLGGLEIDYTDADPLRSGRAVLYSETAQPLQLKRYHYAFWVDQPPRLLHGQLLRYLRASGIADRVVDNGQRGATAYRLKTRLLKFEQLRGGQTPEVELALEVSLERLPSGPVLWTTVYSQRQVSGKDDMHATAAAMHMALAEVLQALQQDLAGTSLVAD